MPVANISPQGSGSFNMKSYDEIIVGLSQRYGISNVFTDFLDIIVCTLSLGAKEEQYLKIVSKYEKQEVNQLADAFASLVYEMDNNGQGLKDCLGDFFVEHLSFGKNGQFFTPEPICKMMAMMTNPVEIGKKVGDCSCGSGRTLMAAAKVNRLNSFYGADIDRTCCLMAVVNFCLNGMCGEIAWMDSLSNRYYGGWQIDIHPEHRVPFVKEISEAESYIVLRLKDSKEEMKSLPTHERVKVEAEQTSLWGQWE
ncbi:MAG TPA: N-6 DNA methylase [Paludibacter sp.]